MLPVLGATDGADGLILGPTLGPAEMLDGADGDGLTSILGETEAGAVLTGILISRAVDGTSGTLGSTAVGADGATDGVDGATDGVDGANVYVLGSMSAGPTLTDGA